MNTYYIGDVHTKTFLIEAAEALLKRNEEDQIVFVGDYVDEWHDKNDKSMEKKNINILLKVIELKHKWKNRITFLIGNHELSYMGFPCSGHVYSLKTKEILKENINCFQVFCLEENRLVSHGGLTSNWLELVEDLYNINNIKELINFINQGLQNWDKGILTPLSKASFTSGGSSWIASPLWARPEDHSWFNVDNLIQIVGHTPISKEISKSVKTYNTSKYYYIDSFSVYRDLEPIGKQDILIYDHDNKEFSTIELKKLIKSII